MASFGNVSVPSLSLSNSEMNIDTRRVSKSIEQSKKVDVIFSVDVGRISCIKQLYLAVQNAIF